MHYTFKNQFVNIFPEMMLEAKLNSVIPIVKFFIDQLENHGFSIEEILLAVSGALSDRKLGQTVSHLDDAAREAGRSLEPSQDGDYC